VSGQFASYGELATKVHHSGAAEFKYNRLEEEHMMQPASIVPYVSLLHFMGLLRMNDTQKYECLLDKEPTIEGMEELVTRKAVEKLEEAGFNRIRYERVAKKMLRQSSVVLPSIREIYQAMALKITEPYFVHLSELGGVRSHFGFTIVTRRVMLPTQVAA
jgi:hypothetical protein